MGGVAGWISIRPSFLSHGPSNRLWFPAGRAAQVGATRLADAPLSEAAGISLPCSPAPCCLSRHDMGRTGVGARGGGHGGRSDLLDLTPPTALALFGAWPGSK